MGWEIQDFTLSDPSGSAAVFQYELVIRGSELPEPLSFRGDGLVVRGGRVMLNRRRELNQLAEGVGLESGEMAELVARHIRELCYARVAQTA